MSYPEIRINTKTANEIFCNPPINIQTRTDTEGKIVSYVAENGMGRVLFDRDLLNLCKRLWEDANRRYL